MVKSSQERLQFELYSQINKNESLSKSLGEPERVAEERKSLIATNETLKKALKVLQRDPDITSNGYGGEDELEEALRAEAMQKRREDGDKKLNQSQQMMSGNGAGQQPQNRPTGPPGGMPPNGGVRPVGAPMGGPGGNPGMNPGMNPVRPGGPGGNPLGGGPGPNTGNLFGNSGPLGQNGAP